MQKLKELENFYETKISKDDLIAAINSLGTSARAEFEQALRNRLTVKEHIFTFLSNVSTYDEFLYIWKSFSEQPNGDVILTLAHKVVKDEFDNKGDVGIAIRHVLAAKQKMEG